MSKFGAISPRVGVVRLDDVAGQVPSVDAFSVAALDVNGVPVTFELRFAQKWGGRGWQRQLACQVCGGPARVLEVRDGEAACGRCSPRTTEHHRHKNMASWRGENAIADQLVRGVLKGPGPASVPVLRAKGRRLSRAAMRRAGAALEKARRTLQAVDELSRRSKA